LSDVLAAYRITPTNAALLVVDMQRGFLDVGAAMEVASGRDAVRPISSLAAEFRRVAAPVVYTRFVWSPTVPTLVGELRPQHKPPTCCCMEGDPSVAIVDGLAPRAGDLVVDKHGYDAFHETRLDYALRSLGRTHLVVTGVMTEVCVLATVTSAMHREYRVSVVSDAVATKWDDVQRATLALVSRCYGRVVASEDALAETSLG
jgi:nicotinamidase-related amidase